MTKARILADYVAGGTTAAEFDYMDGVTSNVQTQLDAKLPLAGGTMTGNIVMGDDTSIGIADDAERIEFDGAGDISVLGAKFGVGVNPGQVFSVLNPASNATPAGVAATTCLIQNNYSGEYTMIVQGAGTGSTPILDCRDGSGNQKFVFREDGGLGIGTANNSLDNDQIYIDTSVARYMVRTSGSSVQDKKCFSFICGSNGEVGHITLGPSSTNFSTSSDYRLKENVVPMSGSITRLKELKPIKFNFIGWKDTTVDGFLAHEAKEVVPEAVIGEKDAMTEAVLYVEGDELPEGKNIGDEKEAEKIDPQAIDQSKLVPLLVGALQESIARIEALETENTALKTRMDALEARVTTLESA